jgi:hypothetical protein
VEEELLIDESLVPDPDENQEMGPRDIEPIADEDLKGSRFLLVRRSVEPLDLDGSLGSAVELACTFQPALGARFTWAQLVLRLTAPERSLFIDVAPHDVREGEPVRFTVDVKGKLGLKYSPVEASSEGEEKTEFAVYHCAVQGSGSGTALARWDFRENPHTRNGLGQDQSLTLTLPFTGKVSADVRVATRVARGGLAGAIEGIRDLILRPDAKRYTISFEIPERQERTAWTRFLRTA